MTAPREGADLIADQRDEYRKKWLTDAETGRVLNVEQVAHDGAVGDARKRHHDPHPDPATAACIRTAVNAALVPLEALRDRWADEYRPVTAALLEQAIAAARATVEEP